LDKGADTALGIADDLDILGLYMLGKMFTEQVGKLCLLHVRGKAVKYLIIKYAPDHMLNRLPTKMLASCGILSSLLLAGMSDRSSMEMRGETTVETIPDVTRRRKEGIKTSSPGASTGMTFGGIEVVVRESFLWMLWMKWMLEKGLAVVCERRPCLVPAESFDTRSYIPCQPKKIPILSFQTR
jgi:hypothetical protein